MDVVDIERAIENCERAISLSEAKYKETNNEWFDGYKCAVQVMLMMFRDLR